MWWIIAVIVVVLWAVVGGVFPATGSNGGPPLGTGCDACKNLKWWWSGLRPWQKFGQAGWYNWKRIDCYLKGCSTD